MAQCELTGKGPVSKNLVSHSNIKTKSVAKPNIKPKKLHSQALNEFITLNIAASTLRTLENKKGLDSFILAQEDKNLSKRALTAKARIRRRLAGKDKKSAK
ncbi:MAG: 50S ribosomal protein L28 [Bdellovibrionales bacterium]